MEEALESILLDKSACIFTMGKSLPSYSSTIMYDTAQYYLFDPHSRNEAGMPTSDCCAALSVHRDLDRHLSAMFDNLKDIPFEVAEISVIEDNTDRDISDFEGFSEVSDGDLACRLYLAQEISDVSSVSSVSMSSISLLAMDSISDITHVDEPNTVTLKPAFTATARLVLISDQSGVTQHTGHSEEPLTVGGCGDQSGVTKHTGHSVDPLTGGGCGDQSGVTQHTGHSVDPLTGGGCGDQSGVTQHTGHSVEPLTVGGCGDQSGVTQHTGHSVAPLSGGGCGDQSGVTQHTGHSDDALTVGGCGDQSGVIQHTGHSVAHLSDGGCGDQSGVTRHTGHLEEPLTVVGCGDQSGVTQHTGHSVDPVTVGGCGDQCGVTQHTSHSVDPLSDGGCGDQSGVTQHTGHLEEPLTFGGCGDQCGVTQHAGHLHEPISVRGCCDQTGEGQIKRCRKRINREEGGDQRATIFHEFWGSSSYVKQKEFICNSVTETKVERRLIRDKIQIDRKISRKYLFTVDGKKIDDCQQFNIDTLDISVSAVSTATHKPPPLAHISCNDKRGKHSNRRNRIPQELMMSKYLEQGLNLSKIYTLYTEKCESRNDCPVKESMYRHILNTQYNIAFNKPLKDMCDFCFQYTNM
ncbi:hypothetical protein MAR_007231 [Mya arenaria]|uniref:Ubiquitin-like domain-containing protein n=1 Tax=Mya arenaria TaxID=6604 RepID=A0ABY7DIC7_MYAAR|nr:hypothetical protein MAR_007231 [Mya arenaria]